MQELLKWHRAQSNIDPVELASFVYGSKRRFEHIMEKTKIAKQHGIVPDNRFHEMSRKDAIQFTQLTTYHGLMTREIDFYNDPLGLEEIYEGPGFHFSGSIGSLMTTQLIMNMGTPEQQKWADNIKNHVWFSCYAQTELATGSDVQNLGTLAVYDPKTKEFVLHNPTIESMKWWPGDLGIVASHAAVFAKVMANGKDQGVHAFFVEIRDPKTHIPHPGVEIGDIGPKLSFKGKDNGFLRFNNYKIPQSTLLGKYLSMDDQGNLKNVGNPKRMYTSMMKMRTILLTTTYSVQFKCATIATRYALYRTQFTNSRGAPIPIYEYQMQREKLFKEIGRAYLMQLSTAIFKKSVAECERLALNDDFSQLQNTHVNMCSFKALFTWWHNDGIGNLIKACGGHGYSMYSGLPHMLIDMFPNQILEGENSVLLLQVARQLIKCLGWIKKGEEQKVTGPFKFLVESDKWSEYSIPEGEAEPTAENIIGAFRRGTCVLLEKLGIRMFTLVQQHKDAKLVWDTMIGTDLQRVAKLYSVLLVLDTAWQNIVTIQNKPIKSAIELLFQFAGTNLVEEYAASLLEAGAITPGNIEQFNSQKIQLLDKLKPHGLVLAEGMQWDDAFLGSAIGSSDKDPYETLYNWAKQLGQLNQFENQIHPAVLEFQLKISKFREQRL
jgi:acyl-CoA oxidase